jgi:hypothetical protein
MPESVDPLPPPAAPKAIRARLTSTMAAEFDREWTIVIDEVKKSLDLADLHSWLNKWRHNAYLELRDPGSYYRMLAKIEQIMRTGQSPEGSVSEEEVKALIRDRLGRQVQWSG